MKKLALFMFGMLGMIGFGSSQCLPESEIVRSLNEPEEVFPVPVVPVELTEPDERVSYLLRHYWEKVDFNQHILSRQDILMEQGFKNFISLFPKCEAEVLQEGVRNLFTYALVARNRIRPLIELAEKYLYHLESAWMNEEYYRLFVETFLQTDGVSFAEKEMLRFQLAAMDKNRMGTKVTNFSFWEEHGRIMELSMIDAPSLLLFFYDAECDECRKIWTKMKRSKVLKDLIKDKQIKVVSICLESDWKRWKCVSRKFPKGWLNGRMGDVSKLYDDYVFRAMPTFYLVDREKMVILKDVSWHHLVNYWNR